MLARFLLLVIVLALGVFLFAPDLLDGSFDWPDRDRLQAWIDAAGIFGPLLVVTLMGLAIVASPLPSAPIALAAGAAGAYGQVRRHASDVLTGVAVAVALVPPLAVVGITLQLTEWQLALGATLLFLANVVGIVIAASATFLAAGFVPGRHPPKGHTQILRGVSWAAIAQVQNSHQSGESDFA